MAERCEREEKSLRNGSANAVPPKEFSFRNRENRKACPLRLRTTSTEKGPPLEHKRAGGSPSTGVSTLGTLQSSVMIEVN